MEIDKIFPMIWQEYGFKGNPFDPNALSLYQDTLLPIDKAFVGRHDTQEAKLLMNLLGSSGGNRIVVEGEIGVGKTTFINYYRYLAEYKAGEKEKLFTSFGEIPFHYHWEAKDFLLNILSHLIHKLVLVYGVQKVASTQLFEELLVLDKVYLQSSFQIEGQILGIGGGFGKSRQVSIPPISEARLVFYIQETIQEMIRRGYRGVILHFDNLELLTEAQMERVQLVFQNIRDLLQIREVYFIFIAQTGFFRRIISPLERVRSIFFGWPIFVPPLTETEVIMALQKRYQLLAMKNVQWVKPVEDECIAFLYQLYDGKIRFVMDALQAILTRFSVSKARPLTLPEVQHFLADFMEEKILQNLTPREFEMLMQAASWEQVTNTQLVKDLQLDKHNISKYLQKFLELGFMRLVKKQGRNIYYEASTEAKVLYRSKYAQKAQPTNQSVLTPRHNKILTHIQTVRQTTIEEMASVLDVSYPTARNDMEKLTTKGLLKKDSSGRRVYFSLAATDCLSVSSNREGKTHAPGK
jgi:DNA-binding MarR family transcriptional regulator